jgi:predicted acyltransferase
VAAVVLGALYHLSDVRNSRAWAFPFVILGTNSILLYTLASNYRWRFLSIPNKLAGVDVSAGLYGPVVASLTFLAMLWLLAFALYRTRVFVKI